MYKYTQVGYGILIFLSIVWLFLFYKKDSPISLGLLALCMILFSTLTVRLSNGYLEWYFGPYIWKKKISIQEVERVSIEPIKWYYGYGVRYLGDKTLYTVSGSQAVRLDLRSGEIIMLGSGNAAELLNSLQQEISNPPDN